MTFSQELTLALRNRRLTHAAVAERAGLHVQTVSNLARGRNEPTMPTAAALAEALDWPALAVVTEQARRRRCLVCQARFVTMHLSSTKRVYCGHKCQQADHLRKQRVRRAQPYRVAAKRLASAQKAIEAFCLTCEPVDRVCRDNTCPLREFSPLAFVPMASLRIVKRGAAA